MQGPFSQELNVALLRQYHIQWMVTKASGRTGGYPEKQAAALEAGAGLVVIEKPEEETGYSWEEICSLLTEELGLVPHWQVTVAGIGPGGEEAIYPGGVGSLQERGTSHRRRADVKGGGSSGTENLCSL